MPFPESVSSKGMPWLPLFPVANRVNERIVTNLSGLWFIGHFFHCEFFKSNHEVDSTQKIESQETVQTRFESL